MKITVLQTSRVGIRAGADMAGYERDAEKLTAEVSGYLANRWYHRVAAIDIDDADTMNALETAWLLTNSVEDAWYETTKPNVQVAAYAREDGCRSSMVGDLFVTDEGVGNRAVYVVASCGFRKVEGELFNATIDIPNLCAQL